MPTSNGQVGRYDIRRNAIDETKLLDDIISTGKIQDLAVSIAKTAEPNFLYVDSYADAATITTTSFLTASISIDVDIPSHIGQVSIVGWGVVSGFETTSTQDVVADIQIADSGISGDRASFELNQFSLMYPFRLAALSAPGSSVTVGLHAGTGDHDMTPILRLYVLAIGER